MIRQEAGMGINTLSNKRDFRGIVFFFFALFYITKLITFSIPDSIVSDYSLRPLYVQKFICMFPFIIYIISKKNFSYVIFEPHGNSIIKIGDPWVAQWFSACLQPTT